MKENILELLITVGFINNIPAARKILKATLEGYFRRLFNYC